MDLQVLCLHAFRRKGRLHSMSPRPSEMENRNLEKRRLSPSPNNNPPSLSLRISNTSNTPPPYTRVHMYGSGSRGAYVKGKGLQKKTLMMVICSNSNTYKNGKNT